MLYCETWACGVWRDRDQHKRKVKERNRSRRMSVWVREGKGRNRESRKNIFRKRKERKVKRGSKLKSESFDKINALVLLFHLNRVLFLLGAQPIHLSLSPSLFTRSSPMLLRHSFLRMSTYAYVFCVPRGGYNNISAPSRSPRGHYPVGELLT